MIKRFAGWTLLVAACLTGPAMAADNEPVPVNPDQPGTYTVQPGDTLWGISEKFLRNPWQWPEVWHVNEQVGNPHRIFPGDVLRLTWKDGKPSMTVESRATGEAGSAVASETVDPGTGMDVVKLRPAIRELPLSEAIPAIPLRAIKAFLNDSRVATAEELSAAPYLAAGPDRRIIMGRGDLAYGRDVVDRWATASPEYGVYRAGVVYRDPDTDELLGYEAKRVGNARVIEFEGEIATLRILSSEGELRVQDKLLYDDPRAIQSLFNPRAAPEGVQGKIIEMFGSLGYAARNDVVVINLGLRDQIQPGHVFAVMHKGEMVRDRQRGDLIATPAINTGHVIVFRSFEKVSYALVTGSTRPLQRGDLVKRPRAEL